MKDEQRYKIYWAKVALKKAARGAHPAALPHMFHGARHGAPLWRQLEDIDYCIDLSPNEMGPALFIAERSHPYDRKVWRAAIDLVDACYGR